MKKTFLTSILLVTNLLIFSQEYYLIDNKKEILTKTQLEEKVSILNQKAKNIGGKDATHKFSASYLVIETFKRSDSIINKVRLDFKYESTKVEKIYSLESKLLPELNLRDLNSKKVELNDLKGKVTFINLWFTNCFPCVKEIPLLNILKNKFEENVNFVAITFDTKEKVKAFLKKKDFNFQHLVNGKSYLKNDLGNISYPKIIILDQKGVVKYIGEGIPSEYDYEKRKMKERTEKDLVYLEQFIESLIQ